MVLVGYDQEQHHSFRDFDDSEELRYLTLLVPLMQYHAITIHSYQATNRWPDWVFTIIRKICGRTPGKIAMREDNETDG